MSHREPPFGRGSQSHAGLPAWLVNCLPGEMARLAAVPACGRGWRTRVAPARNNRGLERVEASPSLSFPFCILQMRVAPASRILGG